MFASATLLSLSIIFCATSSCASASEIAVFHFDEGKGVASEGSKGHGVSLKKVKWVEGKRGMGLRFETNKSFVSIKHQADMTFTGPFTLQCWIKPEGYKTGSVHELMTKAHGGQGPGWRLFIAWGTIQFRTGEGRGAGKTYWALSTKPEETEILNGQWNQIAVTRDKDRILRIYLNGRELAKSEKAFEVVPTKRPLSIGNFHEGYEYPFKGVLDEVAIYGRAKTAKELFLENRSSE